ncbi:hypothetical protein BDW75DRAFT_130190 [Aspergillus navahoensis]
MEDKFVAKRPDLRSDSIDPEAQHNQIDTNDNNNHVPFFLTSFSQLRLSCLLLLSSSSFVSRPRHSFAHSCGSFFFFAGQVPSISGASLNFFNCVQGSPAQSLYTSCQNFSFERNLLILSVILSCGFSLPLIQFRLVCVFYSYLRL